MRTRMSAIIFVALLALMGTASAQETTGTLTGKLVDTQGLAVPGATVTVTGQQGSKSFVSDEEGRFSAPFLTPGNYDVRAELRRRGVEPAIEFVHEIRHHVRAQTRADDRPGGTPAASRLAQEWSHVRHRRKSPLVRPPSA